MVKAGRLAPHRSDTQLTGKSNSADHLMVHTGTDSKANMVHRNDGGTNIGRDGQILLAAFAAGGRPNSTAGPASTFTNTLQPPN